MVTIVPKRTNTERQREFRRRNPGYYGRLHARQRAMVKAYMDRCKAEALREAQAARAAAAIPYPTGDEAVGLLFDPHSV